MNLAVIPARGGSKRIPGKNIRPFLGRPIIAYSIEAALGSGCFDRVVVSTDSREIAEIASGLGAEVPFIRPTELSDDYASTLVVVAHAIEKMLPEYDDTDLVCCIYATAPFIRPEDLTRCRDRILEGDWDYVFPVASYSYPIQRAVRIVARDRIEMIQPEHWKTRSQDLEETYHDAGQFYWGRPEAFVEERPIFSRRSSPVVVPRYRVQDIDTPEDWHRAEAMYKSLKEISSE